MAIARTGVFVDDYLECEMLLTSYTHAYIHSYISKIVMKEEVITVSLFVCKDSSTLPAELQRLLNTIRELDERSQGSVMLFLFFGRNATGLHVMLC